MVAILLACITWVRAPGAALFVHDKHLLLRLSPSQMIDTGLEDVYDPRLLEFGDSTYRYALVSGLFGKREYVLIRTAPSIRKLNNFTTDYKVEIQVRRGSQILLVGESPYEFGRKPNSGEAFATAYRVAGGKTKELGKRWNTGGGWKEF